MSTALVHPKESKIKTSLTDAFAGAAAGAAAKTISAPIERIKLLKQLQHSVDPKDAEGLRGSAWSVAKTVCRNEGILAFWRGNTPNVLQQAGTTALNFMFMDWYKSAINPIVNLTLSLPSNRPYEDRIKRRKMISAFLSGGLAGGTALTVLYPVAFLRTRLALDVGNHQGIRKYPRGMRDVFCSIMKTDGIKGLYQGYGIAISGVILYRAMHLGGYDNIKTELLHRRRKKSPELDSNDELTLMERFVCAQIVSIVAGTMCYPIDSVRRRMMMQAGKPMAERKYSNSLNAFRRIFVDEGMKGFYLGIGPNLFRSFGGALLLVGYDTFKGMVG